MKTFFVSLLGGVVALFLFVMLVFFTIGGLIATLGMAASGSKAQPAEIILELDLREPFSDQPPTDASSAFFGGNSFINTIEKLDAAASDPRVKGVFIRASDTGIGNSRAEELRTSLLKLRNTDKFVIAHTQGMMGIGPSSLRSISAADEIWLQPGSDIIVPGMTIETLFIKDLLDSISVKAQIEQFYEYKNSPSTYKETDYTEPHRAAMTKLITDIWSISVQDIASDRGFSDPQAIRTLLESGALSGDEAVKAGLVTGLKWPEDAREDAKKQAGDKAVFESIYAYIPPALPKNAPLIAVVGGEGAIITGGGQQSPFSSDPVFASDKISAALLAAGRNKDVKAVVFRVDSGGGSAVASEQIWRAVQRVREDMGKPVVVSMGSMAASGGYYVSAGADAILASRTTITGSIGVFGGKMALADGLRRIGVNPSTISVGGDFSSAFGLNSFTDAQQEELHGSLERTYDRFMQIVSEGRELPESRVREIARGRVWSGEDAKALNLINDTGGYLDAIKKAKELANIPADTKVQTLFYPEAKSIESLIADMFGATQESTEAATRLNALMSDPRIQEILAEASALQSGQTQMRAPAMITD